MSSGGLVIIQSSTQSVTSALGLWKSIVNCGWCSSSSVGCLLGVLCGHFASLDASSVCSSSCVRCLLGESSVVTLHHSMPHLLEHYRKDALCRAPNDLSGAFCRAHGKGHSLPCAYATPHGSDKCTVQISLSCVAPQARTAKSGMCCVSDHSARQRGPGTCAARDTAHGGGGR
jgi:hypothetical protein